MIVILRTFSAQ